MASPSSSLSPSSSAAAAAEEEEDPPPTHIRWFHAGHGLAHLDLLASPVSVPVPTTKTKTKVASASAASSSWTRTRTWTWTGLTRDESDSCEAAWLRLDDELRAGALAMALTLDGGVGDGDGDGDGDLGLGLPVAAPVVNEDGEVSNIILMMLWSLRSTHTDAQEELILGVPIGKERLFEVDVRTLRVRRLLASKQATRPIAGPTSKPTSRCMRYIGRSPARRSPSYGACGCTIR
jgi:hypothetical protein